MPVQAGGKLQAGLACIYPCAGLGMQERFRGTGAGGLVPAGTEQNTPRFFCHLRVGVGRSGIFPLCPLQIYFSGVSLRPSNGTCLHPLPAHPAEPRHPACPPPRPQRRPRGGGHTGPACAARWGLRVGVRVRAGGVWAERGAGSAAPQELVPPPRRVRAPGRGHGVPELPQPHPTRARRVPAPDPAPRRVPGQGAPPAQPDAGPTRTVPIHAPHRARAHAPSPRRVPPTRCLSMLGTDAGPTPPPPGTTPPAQGRSVQDAGINTSRPVPVHGRS